MNNLKKTLVFCLLNIVAHSAFCQSNVEGIITDSHGNTIEGANVVFKNTDFFTVSNAQGFFSIKDVALGHYVLNISHIGFKSLQKPIEVGVENSSLLFQMEEDLLNLQTVVVTGTFEPRTLLESNTAVTSMNSETLKQLVPRGTADVLQNIPGTFADGSAGEVFTKVYTRGISASAEDDLGWYYVSLQEDGLPVSLVQHSYYSPDLFHRLDLTTNKVEAIRGGSASITALNAPGGIYNFISKGVSETFNGEIQLQSAIQGKGNLSHRADVTLGGPLGSNWFYNAGGHYRYDEGARNTDFTFSKGGQFKFNATKKHHRGYLKFYGKILDDYTNRWTGVAAVNWNDPKPAFGQDFNTTSLMMPAFSATIPDGRHIAEGATTSFDPSKGVHAKDLAFGFDILHDLGDRWSIRNNTKFSSKDANWQTSISNAYVSLNNPLAYFISGADFPIGEVVFRDTKSGLEMARLSNSGILGGNPIQYIGNGTLPNDGIMGTSTWFKDNKANEWMNQLTLRKQWENHDFNMGLSLGLSDTSLYTQGSFGYVTYEPNPKMLEVTLENPNEPILYLSDKNGVSNYGGLFYVNADAKVSQFATFLNDRWRVSDRLHLDFGLRIETINHKGSKDRYAPYSESGGVDGNPDTAYDNGVLASTGVQDLFNYNYSYVSYSAGINYRIQDEAAIFTRFSKGNKAPELNYYFNNFSNVPINKKGEIQNINQLEVGLKYNLKDFSFTSTAFWSELKNISVTNFEFDEADNSVFYTPNQSNTSRTIGLELESVYAPFENFLFRFNGVLQDAKASAWSVYDAAGSVDETDDSLQDFSGNQLPFNPNIMFHLSSEYQKNKVSAFFKWQFMGEREGNVANRFQLPAYSIFNLGAGYAFNKQLSVNLLVSNLFNSEGLANFFGANDFGANANGVNAQFIQDNPDASFVVVPVLPRATALKLNYVF
ncbi:TonB-dependent receptor [Mariniflexile ostreae]|uniref:TonB-dependent receptor n=1 Tax=Mariniflexile ostreae TaxID=1520892 RepID=A0ABV5FFE5_9FLAO